MGRILSEKGLSSPRFAGPSEEDQIPERLRVDGEIPTWAQATRRFTSLIEFLENEDIVAHRVLNFETFTEAWAGAVWNEMYRIDQKACEWAESTILLTFSSSYWLNKESTTFIPPVTYVTRLQSSKQARQKALSRVLSDVPKWQSIRAIGGEGHNGYPRVFLGLYLSTKVEKSVFEPVLRAHVNNCPSAKMDSHRVENVVSVEELPTHRSQLIHGIGQRIPGLESGNGITSESWEKQKIATTLHGGGWRLYSFGRSI